MLVKVCFRHGRWDVLMEILDAQKQRISRFEIPKDMNLSSAIGDADTDILGKCILMSGIDLRINMFDTSCTPYTRNHIVYSSGTHPLKKRKITGPKRIQFETTYARVSSQLDSIGKLMYQDLDLVQTFLCFVDS